MTLTLADLKARERQEVTFTLECSGNTGLPFFTGGIGNATWAGTPLAAAAGRGGRAGAGHRGRLLGGGCGRADLAEEMTITEQFARSMSLARCAAVPTTCSSTR